MEELFSYFLFFLFLSSMVKAVFYFILVSHQLPKQHLLPSQIKASILLEKSFRSRFLSIILKIPLMQYKYLGFNPAKVEVVGVSTQDSFAKIFIQKTIDNTSGYVRLTGGIPNPGWAGTNGLFETIYLKAKS